MTQNKQDQYQAGDRDRVLTLLCRGRRVGGDGGGHGFVCSGCWVESATF